MLIIGAWFLFYFLAVAFRLERFGLEVKPLYALYKSTKLNSLLKQLGQWRPGFWQFFGNLGVASFPGQVIFMAYVLFRNLYNIIYIPSEASPVSLLIPGLTIRFESLPLFLAVAGVVILLHELAHGVMCVVEEVPVRSTALLVAVVTFGGAVEPDEKALEAADLLSRLRIYASGSLMNLFTGLCVAMVFYFGGGGLPEWLEVFLIWLLFLSTNMALLNMLPIYPLDGGQFFRAVMGQVERWGSTVERAAMYGFLALVGSNLVLSFWRFGLIPL